MTFFLLNSGKTFWFERFRRVFSFIRVFILIRILILTLQLSSMAMVCWGPQAIFTILGMGRGDTSLVLGSFSTHKGIFMGAYSYLKSINRKEFHLL